MMKERIEKLLQEMTLEEKVSLCHADSLFSSGGAKRLGVESLVMSDGPHGVRATFEADAWEFLDIESDKCTYLPTATALAATWNPELGKRFGKTLGEEARYRGKDIILGPGINIIRTPLGGRNFEYFSEDPCLIGKIAPKVVEGIQEQDVAACVKHYCLNNQELDRYGVDIKVSKRALHELYLRAFYKTIIEGNALSVMGAYNQYEGQFCSHNDYLVNEILKKRWGFQGVYLSDWGGTHDTKEAIFHGLDIEMGTNAPSYDQYYLAENFLEQAKESEEIRSILDDKVRRILRLMLTIHKLDGDRKTGSYNTPEHQQTAYDIAAEAMVLLKNEDHILPLDKQKLKKLLVVGPNAEEKHAAGGNSSGVKALYEITPLQGLKDRLGETVEILCHRGDLKLDYQSIPVRNLNIIDTEAGCCAFKQVAKAAGKVDEICFTDNGCISDGKADCYEIHASVKIYRDGIHSLRFVTDGEMKIYIDGPLFEESNVYTRRLKTGENLQIYVELARVEEGLNFTIDWLPPTENNADSTEQELLREATQADYVIYCGGLDHSYDCEGFDKKSLALPAEQDMLIPKLIEANANTIVLLTAGSPVTMPWLKHAKAVLWTWYAGMEGGHALADILLGEVSPSGKLPFTLPKQYSDTPVARYGEYQSKHCEYKEDVFVGYRGYEKDNIEPMYPFGHGLSYSSFAYSDLHIENKGSAATVSFKIKNIGKVTAKEVAQVYIGDPVCSVARPVKELRNFQKVELRPEEECILTCEISEKDLSFVDGETAEWVMEKGEFTVYVGSSTQDIRLEGSFEI